MLSRRTHLLATATTLAALAVSGVASAVEAEPKPGEQENQEAPSAFVYAKVRLFEDTDGDGQLTEADKLLTGRKVGVKYTNSSGFETVTTGEDGVLLATGAVAGSVFHIQDMETGFVSDVTVPAGVTEWNNDVLLVAPQPELEEKPEEPAQPEPEPKQEEEAKPAEPEAPTAQAAAPAQAKTEPPKQLAKTGVATLGLAAASLLAVGGGAALAGRISEPVAEQV